MRLPAAGTRVARLCPVTFPYSDGSFRIHEAAGAVRRRPFGCVARGGGRYSRLYLRRCDGYIRCGEVARRGRFRPIRICGGYGTLPAVCFGRCAGLRGTRTFVCAPAGRCREHGGARFAAWRHRRRIRGAGAHRPAAGSFSSVGRPVSEGSVRCGSFRRCSIHRPATMRTPVPWSYCVPRIPLSRNRSPVHCRSRYRDFT